MLSSRVFSRTIPIGEDLEGLGRTIKIVLEMTRFLWEENEVINPPHGYILYTDRYYTSPQLCMEALSRGVHVMGTVNFNRTNVPSKKEVGLRTSAKDCKGG